MTTDQVPAETPSTDDTPLDDPLNHYRYEMYYRLKDVDQCMVGGAIDFFRAALHIRSLLHKIDNRIN